MASSYISRLELWSEFLETTGPKLHGRWCAQLLAELWRIQEKCSQDKGKKRLGCAAQPPRGLGWRVCRIWEEISGIF